MVAGGSYLDGGEDNGLAGHGASKAKVAELHRAVRSDQNVLRLHVAVDDAVGVEVVERSNELLADFRHAGFGELVVVLQNLEKLAMRELRDDDELGLRLEGVEHLDDVLVPQVPEDLDLLPQVLNILLRLPLLHDELERDDLPRVLSPALVHLPEAPLAHELDHVVVLHRAQAPRREPRARSSRGFGQEGRARFAHCPSTERPPFHTPTPADARSSRSPATPASENLARGKRIASAVPKSPRRNARLAHSSLPSLSVGDASL